jgi:predicted O-linked N-acetylglucosamine transferase (SPINDLY family)
MELTVDQALRRAVKAHKESDFRLAEALYRAILDKLPSQSDANHNLAIILLASGDTTNSLPLFETARKANPKIKQYWTSHINALLESQQFEAARQVLKEGALKIYSINETRKLEHYLKQAEQKSSDHEVKDLDTTEIERLIDSGEYSEAERILKRHTEKKLVDANVWAWLAKIYLDTNDHRSVEHALNESIKINANLPMALRIKARYLLLNSKVNDAIRVAQTAFDHCSSDPDNLVTLAMCQMAANQIGDALNLVEKVLESNPDNADALVAKASISIQKGDLSGAEEYANRATSVKPNFNKGWGVLGLVHLQQNRLEEAELELQKATKTIPINPRFVITLADIQNSSGRLDDAIDTVRKAADLRGEDALIWAKLGSLYQKSNRENIRQLVAEHGDLQVDCNESDKGLLDPSFRRNQYWQQALNCFERALDIQPHFVEAHLNKGVCLHHLGQTKEAKISYKNAIRLRPMNTTAYINLGAVLMKLGELDEAESVYKKAIELEPDGGEPYYNLAIVLKEKRKLGEAEEMAKQSVYLDPTFAPAHLNLGVVYQYLGKFDKAISSYRKAISLKSDYIDAYSNLNYCLNFMPSISPELIYAEHRTFNKFFDSLENRTLFHGKSGAGSNCLRIGYVSADFRLHSVAYFMKPILENHDKRKFRVHCYYNGDVDDVMTKALRAKADRWHAILDVPDVEAARIIKEDGIDILVDLSGHTAGNRLSLFAMKPAPVQVTYLGYPNTTGLSSIDYRFTDIVADPIGKADAYHCELLYRLPNGFQCYSGDNSVMVNTELPYNRNGYVTFGCFNNIAKVNTSVVQAWSRILRMIPDSQLLLKSYQLNHDAEYFSEFFLNEGIGKDRVKFLGQVANTDDHLKLYDSVDVALDPFPFNGATTTCEALWMGVPVLTLLGDTHVSRVGASILRNVGLQCYISTDIDEYVNQAVTLAKEPKILEELRSSLRQRMSASRLCDAVSFTKDIEDAYFKIWADKMGEQLDR